MVNPQTSKFAWALLLTTKPYEQCLATSSLAYCFAKHQQNFSKTYSLVFSMPNTHKISCQPIFLPFVLSNTSNVYRQHILSPFVLPNTLTLSLRFFPPPYYCQSSEKGLANKSSRLLHCQRNFSFILTQNVLPNRISRISTRKMYCKIYSLAKFIARELQSTH